jgi:predicted transcriptional regulator
MKTKKHTRRRDRMDLYYSILKLCNDTQKHTRAEIKQKLSIPFALLNDYMYNLEEFGWVEINSKDKSFRTSSKGEEFIKKYCCLMQQVENLAK